MAKMRILIPGCYKEVIYTIMPTFQNVLKMKKNTLIYGENANIHCNNVCKSIL